MMKTLFNKVLGENFKNGIFYFYLIQKELIGEPSNSFP